MPLKYDTKLMYMYCHTVQIACSCLALRCSAIKHGIYLVYNEFEKTLVLNYCTVPICYAFSNCLQESESQLFHTLKLPEYCCDPTNDCGHTLLLKELCVLAYTPSLGPFSSQRYPQSYLEHSQSHLAVGSGIAWTSMRTAPGTPG